MTDLSHVEDLEFDLPAALIEQLVALFEKMPTAPLNERNLQEVREEQGVYQLFKDGHLAYIGKTDSEAGLKRRLQRHSIKVSGRQNIAPESVLFKAVRVYVFTAMDLESMLIRHYKEQGLLPAWQHSGFGANDPGRRRDTTELKEDHFDVQFPVDLEIKVSIDGDISNLSVAELLRQMKEKLPYLLRYQNSGGRSREPHTELVRTKVSISERQHTAAKLLEKIKFALGYDWQVTVLPGYVIIYKEKKAYASALCTF